MKIIILIICIIFCSCNRPMSPNAHITHKYYTDKHCICKFKYVDYSGWTTFEDSCHLYKIGDKIIKEQ